MMYHDEFDVHAVLESIGWYVERIDRSDSVAVISRDAGVFMGVIDFDELTYAVATLFEVGMSPNEIRAALNKQIHFQMPDRDPADYPGPCALETSNSYPY